MTSHTSIIGHGRRKRGGFRWEQHGAPLDAFSRLACQSELELAMGNIVGSYALAPLLGAGGGALAVARACFPFRDFFVALASLPALGCPQDPKENSFPAQKGTHEANLMLASSNRTEASSVGGPST